MGAPPLTLRTGVDRDDRATRPRGRTASSHSYDGRRWTDHRSLDAAREEVGERRARWQVRGLSATIGGSQPEYVIPRFGGGDAATVRR